MPKAETPKKVRGLTEPQKTGRPSKYSPEITAEICERLSNGEPLRQICRDDHIPAWQTIYDWMYRDDELGEGGVGLSRAIARARELGYDALAEQCLIIADTPQMGRKTVYASSGDDKKESVTVTEEEMLGHRRNQIETRLKLLAKWDPKRFGDRVALTGADNAPPIQVESKLLFDAVLQNLESKRQVE